MRLSEYIEKHGTHAKRELAEKTGLRWQTIHEIAEGRSVPLIKTARKIEKATDGAVTVFELLGLCDPAESLEATGTGDV